MGFCNNTIVFSSLWLLSLLISHLWICKASEQDLCIPSERQALLDFKQHLLDPSNRLISWSGNTNCCNWTSVACNNVTGHVLQLNLSSVSWYWGFEGYERSWFGGEIHQSMLGLKQLSYLNLSYNHFEGMQIPSFLGSMQSLTYLDLSAAGFSGSIPHQIGNLSNLLHLDLRYNLFSGNIPCQIGNLSNLLYLGLSGDHQYHLDGISLLLVENLQWLSSLSSLQYLELSYVNMSSEFDWLHVLQSLPSLTELHLQACALHPQFHPSITINFSSLVVLDLSDSYDFGASFIPKWIFQLKILVSLQLISNNLQGSIPNDIQNLTLIEDLDLSKNLFNSSIPNCLYSLNHLKSLDLSRNNLHGAISNAIGNLTSMVTLDFSQNQLEGPIPSSLKNLCNLRSVSFSKVKCDQQVSDIIETISTCASHTLQSLSISGSKLYGPLTPQIGIFKNLLSLSLYDNSIRGVIPISLGNLTSLNSLDLSDNSIQGAIPISLGNLTSLNSLYLSENQLEGNPFDVIRSLAELQELEISDNLFHGVVNENHLANFTKLNSFSSSINKLILDVGPNWNPSFQRLQGLFMSSCHLGPHFPSWILSLKYLEILYIPNNNITDSIPTWVWDSFPQAYHFDFSNNDIHGELYDTLKNPINISSVDLSSNCLSGHLPYISLDVFSLDLSNNGFSGSIDSFLCQKNEEPILLEYLNLASNNLSGEIPDCWMMWPNVRIVKFDNNYFSGNLPTSMRSLPWLNSLQLRNNTLSGNFPICLNNSTKLVFLDLTENQFSGSIPLWVGHNLHNLKVFLLRSNKFDGKIPSQICFLNYLHILDLAQNDLSGPIPKCINHLTVMAVRNSSLESYIYSEGNRSSYSITDVLLKLKGRDDEYNFLGLITSIDISSNKLSGEIPREITSLMGLHFLNLSNNHLHGEIPQSIGNMGTLESIDFSNNQLCGKIPSSISNLTFLNQLNLSYNHLQGKIPTGTQLQSFEASSFVGNDLCGPPLPNNCINLFGAPDQNHIDKKSNGGAINGFYVSMSLGFVLGFWVIVGPLLYSRNWRYIYFQFLGDMWFKLQYWWC